MQNPIVTIEMENGDTMKAELYPEIAPNTVNNFISLVNKGYYDGLIFHRVIKGFMIQGGCPNGNGMAVPAIQSKESSARMALQTSLNTPKGCFPWPDRWLRIPQVPSSLLCMRIHHTWTEPMRLLAR